MTGVPDYCHRCPLGVARDSAAACAVCASWYTHETKGGALAEMREIVNEYLRICHNAR